MKFSFGNRHCASGTPSLVPACMCLQVGDNLLLLLFCQLSLMCSVHEFAHFFDKGRPLSSATHLRVRERMTLLASVSEQRFASLNITCGHYGYKGDCQEAHGDHRERSHCMHEEFLRYELFVFLPFRKKFTRKYP
jgi:hypothetical protein